MGEADKRRRLCTKRFRLALWWLTYRLPGSVGAGLGGFPISMGADARQAGEAVSVVHQAQQSSRRLDTPDPHDPHSRKYPKRALAVTLPKKYQMFWLVLLDRPDYELMEEVG
jgi:hypothetical protein